MMKSEKEERSRKNWIDYQGEDRVVSAHELALTFQDKSEYTVNIKSGIPSLDQYTEGFRDGELITISGRTKNGKTLLAQTLSANFALNNHFALWFSFEISARRFIKQFDKIPFIYMPSKLKAHAIEWLEDRIMESFYKYGTRIIFIDHLHYLFDIQRSRNPSLDIGAIIRRLKKIAVDNEFIVFLLCHTSKAKDDNENYEAIRDSSFVAQESDCVIMIKRTPDQGESYARARVEFHRRTGVLEKRVFLQKQGNYLVERAPNPNEIVSPKNGKGGYRDHDND